jgi:hypothetical protein
MKLGASVPPKMTDDHKTLVEGLNKLLSLSRTMLDLVVLPSNDSGAKLESTVAELKTAYEAFYEHMDAHFNEEETFWPAEIAKQGEVSSLSLFLRSIHVCHVFSRFFIIVRKFILNANQN